MATIKALVAEAYASQTTVAFTTAENVTAGIAISTSVKSNRSGGASVAADVAVVALAGDKVAATVIDSIEQTLAIENGALVAAELSPSKTELGDNYTMPAGSWTSQAKAFAASTVGKTAAELAELEVVSDALAAAGCTMQNTTAGYKATIIKAAGYAR